MGEGVYPSTAALQVLAGWLPANFSLCAVIKMFAYVIEFIIFSNKLLTVCVGTKQHADHF
jgi:hypothetical protein